MKQLYEWLPADINKLPKATDLQRVCVLLGDTPTVLIFARGNWHWYEDPCGPEYYGANDALVSDDSWKHIQFLTEVHPSIPLGDMFVFTGKPNIKNAPWEMEMMKYDHVDYDSDQKNFSRNQVLKIVNILR